MIERLLSNPLTIKRWRRFKALRRSVVSVYVLIALLFFSFTAEFWANSKPIIMSYKGHIYFPVLEKIHPTIFGQTDTMVTNYRKLRDSGEEDWSLWPLIQWDPIESNLSVSEFPSPPTWTNLMGTDDRGRDVFSRFHYFRRSGLVVFFYFGDCHRSVYGLFRWENGSDRSEGGGDF